MGEWKIYGKNGTEKCAIKKLEYNGEFMGERSVTVTVQSHSPIFFEIGDYLDYRSERFTIDYNPTVLKQARKETYGQGFVYENIKLVSRQIELVYCGFLDYVTADNLVHFSSLPTFSFYCETVKALTERIQANLDRLYTGDDKWTIIVHEENVDVKSVVVSVSNINCWEALALVNSKFGTTFTISGRTIEVGASSSVLTGYFQYGKDKGFRNIEKSSDPDQAVYTRVRATGNSTNMPQNYYRNKNMYVYAPITGLLGPYETSVDVHIPITFNTCFTSEIGSNNTSGAMQYNTWVSTDKTNWVKAVFTANSGTVGYSVASVMRGLPGQDTSAFDVFMSKITSAGKLYFIKGIDKNKWPASYREYTGVQAVETGITKLMLPSYPDQTTDPYIDSANIAKYGIREISIAFDGTDGREDIYPTIKGMTAEELESAGISVDLDAGDNGKLDEVYSATQIADDGIPAIEGEDKELPATFKIVLKDIGFDINDYRGEGAEITMTSGKCESRSFNITACEKSGNKYKLTCERTEDTDLNRYFPYSDYNIASGDTFVITGIEMPDVYILAASERLKTATEAWLAQYDYTVFSVNPKIDNIKIKRHDDEVAASGQGISIHATIREGLLMSLGDEDLDIDGNIFIDRLVIKEGESLIPQYEVTLCNDKTAGTLQRIQQQITNINTYGTQSSSNSGAVDTAQVNQIVKNLGDNRYLSKLYDDIAKGKITSLKGFQVGQRFVTGLLGEGGEFVREADGTTYIEADKLYIRMKAFFDTLEVRKMQYSSGNRVASAAGIKTVKVSPVGTYEGSTVVLDDDGYYHYTEDGKEEKVKVEVTAYRCYFRMDDDEQTITNDFVVGDQARCDEFNVSSGKNYYWRKVVGTSGQDIDEDGLGYIDLSATDCASGSGIPQAQDSIVQLGNDSDPTRQGAIIEYSSGENAPSYQMYQGINSYSLEGKNILTMGFSSTTGKAYMNVYGDFFVGDPNGSTYMRYNQENKQLEIKGTVKMTSASPVGDQTLQEYVDGRISSAGNWTQEQIESLITDTTSEDFADIETALQTLQNQADNAKAAADAYDYLKQALKDGNETLVDGGLILSTLIALRDANQKVWSGINGAYDATKKGNGIAAWYGGGMVDHESAPSAENYAKSLFRFDGSGYLASGNISWDSAGKVTIKDLYTLIGNETSFKENVLNKATLFSNLFHTSTTGTTVGTETRILPQAAFQYINIVRGSESLSGTSVLNRDEMDARYVTKGYFNRLFQAYGGTTPVSPNDVTTDVDSLKVLVGIWTEQYVSALGKNSSGGSSGSGGLDRSTLFSILEGAPNSGEYINPKFLKLGTGLSVVDGKLTSTASVDLSGYVTLNTAQTISARKTFSVQQAFTIANGTSPFTVTSSTLVSNLNADMLDGYHLSYYKMFNTAYSRLITIVITSTYRNESITFSIEGRSSASPCHVSIRFKNENNTDPSLSSFTYTGDSAYGSKLHLCKTATSTWEVWLAITQSYDRTNVYNVTPRAGVSITPDTSTTAANLPTTLIDPVTCSVGSMNVIASQAATATVAVTAMKLGTATVGSAAKGIYLNAGTATAMTYELNATLNGGTANYLAYYSGANAVGGTSYLKLLSETNALSKTVSGLEITGTGLGNAADLTSGKNGGIGYGDGGPQIRFTPSSAQHLALIATQYDNAGGTASLHLVSDTNHPMFKTDYVSANRLYLASGVYLEYDSDKNGIHVVGAGLYSDKYISALGGNSSGSGSSFGGIDQDKLWEFLAASGKQQINSSHLTNALSGYATQSWANTQLSNYALKTELSDTKVTVNNTNPTTGTWYYPVWYTGTSGTGNVNANNGLRHYSLEGTADAVGRSIIQLGNSIASGTAGNKYGTLRIYSQSAYYADLNFISSATENRIITIPDVAGTLINTGNYTSYTYSSTASRTANTVLAAPNGSAGAATFRALVAADIPNLAAGKITSGTLPIARGGTNATTQAGINYNIAAALGAGTSNFTDGTELVTSYATDNGFASSAAVNVMYKRPASAMWGYIKGKANNYYPSIMTGNGTNIASNTDLDDILAAGTYICVSGSVAGTLSNTPYTSGNFKLIYIGNAGTDGAASGNYGSQLLIAGNQARWFTRSHSDSTFGDWKEFAFLTSNVASATKLQTSRTLWGQSFDGTGNVSGNMTGVGAVYHTNGVYEYWADSNGDNIGISSLSSANNFWLGYGLCPKGYQLRIGGGSIQFYYGAERKSGMYLSSDGNFGIGTTSPSYKLHVSGTLGVTGATTLSSTLSASGNTTIGGNITMSGNGKILYGTTTAGAASELLSLTSSDNVRVGYGQRTGGNTYVYGTALSFCTNGTTDRMYISSSGNVGINTTSPSQRLHVDGNIYATGGVTALSDMRYKDVIGRMETPLESLASLPVFRFTWKDGEDKGIHVGTSAQAVRGIIPELVLDNGGQMSVDYSVLGTVLGIMNSRRVLSHEERIAALERENEQLRNKIRILEERA